LDEFQIRQGGLVGSAWKNGYFTRPVQNSYTVAHVDHALGALGYNVNHLAFFLCSYCPFQENGEPGCAVNPLGMASFLILQMGASAVPDSHAAAQQ
jgi:hypothetical protein